MIHLGEGWGKLGPAVPNRGFYLKTERDIGHHNKRNWAPLQTFESSRAKSGLTVKFRMTAALVQG